jgi:Tfp pilus assembly protein PilF
MMKLAPIALTVLMTSTAGAASVIAVGGGYASACYAAAESQEIGPDSLDVCDRALEEEALTYDDRVATHVNRGIVFLRRGSLVSAQADFDRALKLDPNEPEAWLNKAILVARHGNGRDALPLVTKALEKGTRRPAVAYFVRAMAYEASGNAGAAYQDFKRARSLAPDWREPVAELARFQIRQP